MKRKIDIVFNELWEFNYTLVLAAYENIDEVFKEYYKFDRNKEITFEKKRLEKRNKQLRKGLSDYIKNELNFFFSKGSNRCNGIGQIILYNFISENPSIKTVKDMIELIERSNFIKIAQYILKNTYNQVNRDSIEESNEWNKEKDNIKWIQDLLENLNLKDIVIKGKIKECIENPEEVKERFVILLKMFYEKSYKKVCLNVKEELQNYIDLYKKDLKKDSKKFFEKYCFEDIGKVENDLIIHISYSLEPGADYWASNNKDKKEYLIIGCGSNKYLELEDINHDEIFDFLKAVADKKRIEILRILKEKSRYVDEIAEKMNMTSATISYHLTILQEFGIVEYKRVNHRFYYELKTEKLKEWFDKARNNLI